MVGARLLLEDDEEILLALVATAGRTGAAELAPRLAGLPRRFPGSAKVRQAVLGALAEIGVAHDVVRRYFTLARHFAARPATARRGGNGMR